MALDGTEFVRVSKRIRQAIGYMELGMTQRALDHLAGIKNWGPFEAPVQMLRGEAHRLLELGPQVPSMTVGPQPSLPIRMTGRSRWR